MASKTLLTLREFQQLEADDNRHELEEGELITLPLPSFVHGCVSDQILLELRTFLSARVDLGRAVRAAGALIQEEPPTVRGPDVAFYRRERVAALPRLWVEGAPDLAVEVLSPSETASRIRRKVREYLTHGGQIVWVVDPELREVEVHEAGGAVRILRNDDVIDAPGVLPGFSTPITRFFDGLEYNALLGSTPP